MHQISVIDIHRPMQSLSHGQHDKDMFVCHESVSYNKVGLSDITALEGVLEEEGYGIHGIVDKEGHKCWARGMGDAIFYHAGGVNERAVGVELVSEIPLYIQAKKLTHAQAHQAWLRRTSQLTGLAILIAAWHNSDKTQHRLIRSNGNDPGVCSHWDVSQHHPESQGHWDCWPYDERNGYFPLEHVLELAKIYAKHGYSF